ncbi:MAG: xanthine dehydrogenase small subunit [Oceanospirillaceae bacterium]
MIEFLLHDEKITLDDIDPNTTVLEFLRNHRQLTGTKEGCASGDCGACTICIVELNTQNQLEYKSINACITFISALHGKQLISVEALKQQNQLHSCQQAMLDSDGSQCGFCTPGIVMSLFALQKNQASYNRHKVQQALAGNLCRCTGYRAIDSAAKQALNSSVVDHFDPQEPSTRALLLDIQQQSAHQTTQLIQDNKSCYIPKTAADLAQLLIKHPQSTLVAGGTDLAIAVTQHGASFNQLIALNQVAELLEYQKTDQQITLGAALSLDRCQRLMADTFDDFSVLLDRFASLQVRNQGTIGGNIANASPIGDIPPALIALDAQLQLQYDKTVRTMQLADFFIDYRKTALQTSEFITNIIIDIPTKPFIFKIYKISKRLDDDISALCAACFVQLDARNRVLKIRLAYGGMAAIAKRAVKTEQALLGKIWSVENIAFAANCLSDDFQPLSDFRASSEYRLTVAKNLLHKFFIESADYDVTGCDVTASDNAEFASHTRIFDYV